MRSSKDYYFVGIQIVLFLLFIFKGFLGYFSVLPMLKIPAMILSIGGIFIVVLAILQLKTNLTPFPTPKENGTLISTGLFTYVRHPIYSGILLFAFSASCYFGSYFQLLISLVLVVLFYFKSTYEEGLLLKKYPDYKDFKTKRGRFLPKW